MIKRYRLQNFKSILDVEVRFSPVTVLAGVSGAGKSSFLESFDLLRFLITGEPAPWFGGAIPDAAAFRPGGWPGHDGFRTRFDLSFSAPGSDRQLTYNLEAAFHHSAVQPVAELLKVAGQAAPLFAWREGKWSHRPEVDGLGAQHHPSKLRWLTALEDANIAYLTLGRGLAAYEFSPQVLTQGKNQRADRALMRDGSNAEDVLVAIMENLSMLPRRRAIEAALAAFSPKIESIAQVPRINELALTVHFNESKVPLPLSRQSAGWRRMLAHLLAIYQISTPQLVIFEEPDSGMSPNLLPILARHLLTAAAELGVQFLLTTHSPDMVRCFPVDAVRWVQMTDKGTRILPVTGDDLPELLAELAGGPVQTTKTQDASLPESQAVRKS